MAGESEHCILMMVIITAAGISVSPGAVVWSYLWWHYCSYCHGCSLYSREDCRELGSCRGFHQPVINSAGQVHCSGQGDQGQPQL